MATFGKWKGEFIFGTSIILLIFGCCVSFQKSEERCLGINDTYTSCEVCDISDEKTLDCHNRTLTGMVINGTDHIIGLDVSYNRLNTFPLILNCTNLVWIDLSYNVNLKAINERALRNIRSTSLRIINLNNCNLLRIWSVPLRNFVPNLEILLIANNSLASFNYSLLQNLENFRLLDATGNSIIHERFLCGKLEQRVIILVEPSNCGDTCAQISFCRTYYLRHLLPICQEGRQCMPISDERSTHNATVENATISSSRNGFTPVGSRASLRNILLSALLALFVVIAISLYQATKWWKRKQSQNYYNHWLPAAKSTTVAGLRFQPKLELPEIPNQQSLSENIDELEKISVHYSTVQEHVPQGKMFTEKEMYFIVCLKNGRIYNRWMGTITTDDVCKCVVFTTAAENALESTTVHWDDFVKKSLDLPKNEHVVNIEGICLKNENFYLVQEHLNCETLYLRLQHCIGSCSSTASIMMTISEVTRHLLGILEGLELLHSYDFLHPGLSTKKVLITNKGICKLYDFCLDNDASWIISNKKSQMICSINEFAPEALYRNEYTKASDVWSMAVVIWEMLSGYAPFEFNDQTMASENVVIQPPQTWPEQYQAIRNVQLFECWHIDCSLRPSIQGLGSSFLEIFQSSINEVSDDNVSQDIAEGYTSMNRMSGGQVND